MDYVWVGLGGFLGANARYALNGWIVDRLGASFPWQTLLINVTGSLACGLLLTLLTEKLLVDPAWRLFLVVGFLGGYTTFSTYTVETLVLVGRGEWLPAVGYVLASNGVGLVAVYPGDRRRAYRVAVTEETTSWTSRDRGSAFASISAREDHAPGCWLGKPLWSALLEYLRQEGAARRDRHPGRGRLRGP